MDNFFFNRKQVKNDKCQPKTSEKYLILINISKWFQFEIDTAKFIDICF